jgi:hypothetical protein
VGEVASLSLDQLGGSGVVVVQSPSGERSRRELGSGALAVALSEGGFWEIREAKAGGRLLATLAANVPAEESRLETFDPTDLRLATGAVDSSRNEAQVADLTPQETERRQGLWWYLIGLVTLLLGIESLVANSRGARIAIRDSRGAG